MATAPTDTKSWNTTLNYIVGKKIAEQALGFVTTVGECITEASTLEQAMQGALDQAVPFLADWLSASLAADGLDGQPTEYISSSRGATAQPDQYRTLAAGLGARTGRTQLTLSVATAVISPAQPHDATDGLLRQVADAGVGSAVVLPLAANGRTPGLLTAFRVAGRRDPEFDNAALRLLTDLAGRLALAAEVFAARPARKEA
ncbi:MAG: GAF domain-containing protein [Pseudonocardiaceae bacterium]